MTSALDGLVQRLRRTRFAQAMRLIEQVASKAKGRPQEVGGDLNRADEPVRLRASERLTTVASDLAEAVQVAERPIELHVNVLGLAGATPALPPQYSEYLLERRRLRDPGIADFNNIFDHRTLSFFYKAERKHSRTIAFERTPATARDPITGMMLSLAGHGMAQVQGRLAAGDAWLAPLASQIGGLRRSAVSLEAVVTRLTGHPAAIVQAEPRWMAIPVAEQTRLGGPMTGRFCRLGGEGGGSAVVGAAALDIQHHYSVALGPVSYAQLLHYCREPGAVRRIAEVCTLFTGTAFRPGLKVLVRSTEIPRLRLGIAEEPALLGRTSWLGDTKNREVLMQDCEISLGTL